MEISTITKDVRASSILDGQYPGRRTGFVVSWEVGDDHYSGQTKSSVLGTAKPCMVVVKNGKATVKKSKEEREDASS